MDSTEGGTEVSIMSGIMCGNISEIVQGIPQVRSTGMCATNAQVSFPLTFRCLVHDVEHWNDGLSKAQDVRIDEPTESSSSVRYRGHRH